MNNLKHSVDGKEIVTKFQVLKNIKGTREGCLQHNPEVYSSYPLYNNSKPQGYPQNTAPYHANNQPVLYDNYESENYYNYYQNQNDQQMYHYQPQQCDYSGEYQTDEEYSYYDYSCNGQQQYYYPSIQESAPETQQGAQYDYQYGYYAYEGENQAYGYGQEYSYYDYDYSLNQQPQNDVTFKGKIHTPSTLSDFGKYIGSPNEQASQKNCKKVEMFQISESDKVHFNHSSEYYGEYQLRSQF